MSKDSSKENRNSKDTYDKLYSQMNETVRGDRRRAKTVHSLYATYGDPSDPNRFKVVPSNGMNNLAKTALVVSEVKDSITLQDEITALKKHCNSLTEDKKILLGRIQFFEEEIRKWERKVEDLILINTNIATSTGIYSKFPQIKSEQELINNLKRAAREKQNEVSKLSNELDQVKHSTRFTRLSELELELKILAIKRENEHLKQESIVTHSDNLNIIKGQKETIAEQQNLINELQIMTSNFSRHEIEAMGLELERLRTENKNLMSTLKEIEATKEIVKNSNENRKILNKDLTAFEQENFEAKEQVEKQTVAQLRVKEELTNETIFNLQAQIKNFLEESEINEEKKREGRSTCSFIPNRSATTTSALKSTNFGTEKFSQSYQKAAIGLKRKVSVVVKERSNQKNNSLAISASEEGKIGTIVYEPPDISSEKFDDGQKFRIINLFRARSKSDASLQPAIDTLNIVNEEKSYDISKRPESRKESILNRLNSRSRSTLGLSGSINDEVNNSNSVLPTTAEDRNYNSNNQKSPEEPNKEKRSINPDGQLAIKETIMVKVKQNDDVYKIDRSDGTLTQKPDLQKSGSLFNIKGLFGKKTSRSSINSDDNDPVFIPMRPEERVGSITVINAVKEDEEENRHNAPPFMSKGSFSGLKKRNSDNLSHYTYRQSLKGLRKDIKKSNDMVKTSSSNNYISTSAYRKESLDVQ